MSNLIKASSVRYAEDIKKVDMNQRADRLQQEYMDQYIADNIALKKINFDEVSRQLENGELDFTPGLNAREITMDENGAEDTDAAAMSPAGAAADGSLGRTQELESRIAELEAKAEQIRAEADSMLEEAGKEADRIVDQARAEADVLKEDIVSQAREDAFNQGMAEAKAYLEGKEAELEEQIRSNKEAYEKQVLDLEPAFVEMVMKYVRKLTGIYEESKRGIILYLIDSAMKGRQPSGQYLIHVSENDMPAVTAGRDRIADIFGDKATFEIIEDKLLEPDHCIIESDSRIFDCSLRDELNALLEDLSLLAEKE